MCFLGNKESFDNNIEHNDPMRHFYSIDMVDSENFVVTATNNSLSHIKPTDTYTYCSRKKFAFRKKEGSFEKCLDGMKKHFTKLREFVNTEKPNLLERDFVKYENF
jgi:N-acetyl-beta-hexosaminidase